MKPQLLTVREASKLLRLGRPKIYDLIKAGKIEGEKIGNVWRVRTLSVEKLAGEIPAEFFRSSQ